MSRKTREIIGLIRGVQSVVEAGVKLQEVSLKTIWDNSSLKTITRDCPKNVSAQNVKSVDDLVKILNDSAERVNTVVYGIRELVNYKSASATKNAAGQYSYFLREQFG